jgi:hypothetical protein
MLVQGNSLTPRTEYIVMFSTFDCIVVYVVYVGVSYYSAATL